MVNKILSNKFNNVLFVDPNAIAANDTVDIYNISKSPENIRPHLEFYCIPRIGNNIILNDNGTYNVENNSNNNIKVNFLGFDSNTGQYTNKYITDIYNQERTNNFEGFGITNVNIKISANYVPEVNIEFIDIKGRSISDINSPYRRLFDVPPPLFKLIVKGGYGLFTEFDLYITKHEISSDESQNLIIKADFIGDRYGVLTDVLLGYLNSVYFMESNSTGIDISSQTKATSFYEFMSRSKVLYSNVDNFKKNSSSFKKQEAIQEKISKIQEIDNIINTFYLNSESLLSDIQIFYNNDINKYSLVNNNLLTANILSIEDNNSFSINLNTPLAPLSNVSTGNTFNSQLPFISNDINPFIKDYLNSVKKRFISEYSNLNTFEFDLGLLNYNINEDIETLTFANNNNSLGLRFSKLIEKNKENLIKLNKELKLTNESLASEANNIVTETISSEPTIGNIFSFILKDTDKFLRLLKQSGDEGSQQRLNNSNTSIKTRGGYPTVINTKGEVIYPGDSNIQEFKNFPEVKFVEKYLNALINKKLTDSEIDRQFIAEGNNTTQTGNESYIPLSSDESYNLRTAIGTQNYYYNFNNDFQKIFTEIFKRYVILRDSIYFNEFSDENILQFYGKAEARNIVYSMIANKKMLNTLINKGFESLDKNNYYQGIVSTIFNNNLSQELLDINKGIKNILSFEIGSTNKIKIDYLSTSNPNYNSIYGIYNSSDLNIDSNQVTMSSTNDIISEYINNQNGLIGDIFSFFGIDISDLEFNQNFFIKKDKNYKNESLNITSDFFMVNESNTILDGLVQTTSYTSIYEFIQTTIPEDKNSISINDFFNLHVTSIAYSKYSLSLFTFFLNRLNIQSFIEIPNFYLIFIGFLLEKDNVTNNSITNIDKDLLIKYYNTNKNDIENFSILRQNNNNENDIVNEKDFIDKFWNKKIIIIKNNGFNNFTSRQSLNKKDFNFKNINDINLNTYLKILISEMLNVANSYLSDLNKEEEKIRSEINDSDLKEQVYYNFKTIYERYLYNKDYKPFADNNGIPIKQSFQFVNRVYKDISQDVIMSYNKLVEDSKTDDISIYTSISNLLSHNNFIFFPFQNFIASGDGNLENWMKCFQVNNSYVNENQSKPSFVCMFTGGYSNYLNTNNSSYPDDGVKIYDFDENSNYVINNNLPQDFLSGNTIYCFRYNYGQQNEAVFNGINLSTTQFNNTDASLKIQDSVINQQYNSNPISKGQSLLSIYRNLSYTLSSGIYYGNVNIQPTQYIQLDNVPLFNGLYMIYEVEHKMSTNNRLETSFKAYRINKYVIRLVKDIALNIFGIDTSVNNSDNVIDNTLENNSNDTVFLQSRVKENSTQFVEKVKDIATKLNVSPDWIMIFIDSESGFDKRIVNGISNPNNIGLIVTLRSGIQGLIQTYKLGNFNDDKTFNDFKNIYKNAPFVNITSDSKLDKTKGYFYTGKIENYKSNDQLDFVYMLLNLPYKIYPSKNPYPSWYHMKAFGFEPYGLYRMYMYGINIKNEKVPEAKGNTLLSKVQDNAIKSNGDVFTYGNIGVEGTFENMILFFNNKIKNSYKYPIASLGTL